LPERESLLNPVSFISVSPGHLLKIIFSFQLHLIHNHLFTFSLLLQESIFHHNAFCNSILGYYGLFAFDSDIFTLLVKMDLAASIIIRYETFAFNFDLSFLMDDNCISLLIVTIFPNLNHYLSYAFIYLPLFYEGDLSTE
jgi:hypothetical protein